MIKLGDLISVSYSNVTIMNGVFEIISFDPCHIEKLKMFNPDILECEVKSLEVVGNRIRVCLRDDENE